MRRVWVWAAVALLVGLFVGSTIGWQVRDWEWRWGSAGEWLAGLGAIAAVIFASSASRSSKRAADTAEASLRSSAQTADKSLAAATDAVLESTRARLDNHAPRLSVLVGPVVEPRFLPDREHLPGGGEEPIWDMIARLGEPMASPIAADNRTDGLLTFVCRGVIANEGSASTRLRLDNYARLLSARSPFEAEWGVGETAPVLPLPAQIGSPDAIPHRPEYVLEPGQRAVFEWYVGHTIGEWIAAVELAEQTGQAGGRFWLEIVAIDLLGTIVDVGYVAGNGRPLRREGRPGQWELDPATINAVLLGVTRRYLALNEGPKPPPDGWE